MPFRFRRSIRIAPGTRLNLGKRGVSATVGERGAHLTVGRGHPTTTVGVPGTDLSYRARLPTAGKTSRRSPHVTWGSWLFCCAIVAGVMWWLGWL
jgi:Protein of unknown function (DUF4236)